MLNGIRLNSFGKINDTLKPYISSSENLEFIYNALFDFELQYVFSDNAFQWRNKEDLIEPINFRNIVEEITLVFKENHNYYDCYFVYDKEDYNTYEQQDVLLKTLLPVYLKKFDTYNKQSKISRMLICEVDVYVYDNGLFNALDYISNLTDIRYNNLLNAMKRDIRKFVLYYGQQTIYQAWTIFKNPDLYMSAIDVYIQVIQSIYTYQKKVVQYSQYLLGPNTSVYSPNEPFINYLLMHNVFDEFRGICFNLTTDYDSLNINDLFYVGDKDVYFLNQEYNINSELDLMKNNIYSIQKALFPNFVDYELNQSAEQLISQRLYNHALKYNILTDNTEVNVGDCKQISFYDDQKIDKLYILYGDGNIIVTPHYARTLYTKNETISLLSDRQVDLSENDGYVVITEDNTLSITDLNELQSKIEQTLIHYKSTIRHMINMLSSGYNKEIIDTNFYKLLRSIAYLIASYKFDLQEVKNSMYLNDLENDEDNIYVQAAKKDTIYNNFGAIIDLPKKDRWTYEQYRKVVTAVFNACLLGPTKDNIAQAITTFIDYESTIYELYKDGDNPIFDNLSGVDLTYRYAVEVHKDLDRYDDADELQADIIYLLAMIKPAQALFLLYISLNQDDFMEAISDVQEDMKMTTIFNEYENYMYDLSDVFRTTDNEKESILNGIKRKLGLTIEKKAKEKLETMTIYKPNEIYDTQKKCVRFKTTGFNTDNTGLLNGDVNNIPNILYGMDRDNLALYLKVSQEVYNTLTEEQKLSYLKNGIKVVVNANHP